MKDILDLQNEVPTWYMCLNFYIWFNSIKKVNIDHRRAIITNAAELSANITATLNAFYNLGRVFSGSRRKIYESREWSVAI